MSKQWGHGFHCGKMAIISDLLRGITLPDGFHKAVYLRQSGGKYCVFECPVCHEDRALFKMTANSGWCNNCRADFQNFSAVHELTPANGSVYPDAVGALEVHYWSETA